MAWCQPALVRRTACSANAFGACRPRPTCCCACLCSGSVAKQRAACSIRGSAVFLMMAASARMPPLTLQTDSLSVVVTFAPEHDTSNDVLRAHGKPHQSQFDTASPLVMCTDATHHKMEGGSASMHRQMTRFARGARTHSASWRCRAPCMSPHRQQHPHLDLRASCHCSMEVRSLRSCMERRLLA